MQEHLTEESIQNSMNELQYILKDFLILGMKSDVTYQELTNKIIILKKLTNRAKVLQNLQCLRVDMFNLIKTETEKETKTAGVPVISKCISHRLQIPLAKN